MTNTPEVGDSEFWLLVKRVMQGGGTAVSSDTSYSLQSKLTDLSAGLAAGLGDSASDGSMYLRKDAAWVKLGLATLTTAQFTMPNWGTNVTISVADTSWMSLYMVLGLSTGANAMEWVVVTAIPSSTSVQVMNWFGATNSGTIPAGTLLRFIAPGVCGWVSGQAGLAPQPPNDTTKFLDGTGLWSSPVRDTITARWTANVNPNGNTVFVANRSLTILGITGMVDVAAGAAATVSVNKAASGTAIASGTVVHSGSFNANGTANTNQSLTLTVTTMASGDRLGLVTTGTFTTSVGSITIYVQ